MTSPLGEHHRDQDADDVRKIPRDAKETCAAEHHPGDHGEIVVAV